MKKIVAFAMLLIVSTSSFSQQSDPSQPITRQDYFEKSKKQKTAAWVLLAGGAGLIGEGHLIGNGDESTFDDAAAGGIFAILGVLSAIGSIPLFIASGRNKRRAMNVSTHLQIRHNSVQSRTLFCYRNAPALSLKLSF
ncbi:MAG: hypothetical protein EOP50_02920 [Sphingobacteriales bacterium]|nr:MAG: hypothetical protein EOP50_02920 [Sphingobacteriales bacterium]